MNFESGTPLAEFQDRLIKQWLDGDHSMSPEDSNRLNGNLWVALATRLGPNNLVIRHRCLQDLFNGDRKYTDEIPWLFTTLTPGLWAEGYSYWRYTKTILLEWAKLVRPDMLDRIKMVDTNFTFTSYAKDGKLWPAPFGDLRKEPLEDSLQNGRSMDYESSPVKRRCEYDGTVKYTVTPYPLGGNTHVPIKREEITVKDGIPEGFKFYEGYDKKYKNGFEEVLDILRPRRILSVLRLL